jgi:putative FmdB family regulatory protein
MPSYDYRCRQCDEVFEVFQRITAEPRATCPACGADDCQRKISGGTFHLKGGGWYASDYQGGGRSGAHAAREPEAKAAPAGGGCGEAGACPCAAAAEA